MKILKRIITITISLICLISFIPKIDASAISFESRYGSVNYGTGSDKATGFWFIGEGQYIDKKNWNLVIYETMDSLDYNSKRNWSNCDTRGVNIQYAHILSENYQSTFSLKRLHRGKNYAAFETYDMIPFHIQSMQNLANKLIEWKVNGFTDFNKNDKEARILIEELIVDYLILYYSFGNLDYMSIKTPRRLYEIDNSKRGVNLNKPLVKIIGNENIIPPEPKPTYEYPSKDFENSKYVLIYASETSTGDEYKADSTIKGQIGDNSSDKFSPNQKVSFNLNTRNNNTCYHNNDVGKLEKLYNSTDENITLENSKEFSSKLNSKATFNYLQIIKKTTIYYKVTKIDGKEVSRVETGRDEHYRVGEGISITQTKDRNKSVATPNYSISRWKNLNTEDYESDKSLLQASNNIGAGIPDFVSLQNTSVDTRTSLDFGINAYKEKNTIFTLLSDNNSKTLSLTFGANSVFGIKSLSRNKTTTVGNSYIASSNFVTGALKNPQSNPTISIQTQSGEKVGDGNAKTTYNLNGVDTTRSYPINQKFRSIKYMEKTSIGDSDGSNFWYTKVRVATLNELGIKNTFSAHKVLDYRPTERNISTGTSDLKNKIYLTSTFIQPVLTGNIAVLDTAGNAH